MIHAVKNQHDELAVHLIELGAEINVKDKEGWFSLMYAVKAKPGHHSIPGSLWCLCASEKL